MAEKRDYYDVLGINKASTQAEIKSAYRKLAKKLHPDNKETGDAEKFKEATEAYSVLSDESKKQTYDQFGHSAFDQSAGGQNPFSGTGFEGFNFGGGFGDLNDLFAQMFGQSFGGRTSQNPNGPRHGENSFMRIKINFMDSVLGRKFTIPLTTEQTCKDCGGNGAKNGTELENCSHCGGKGRVLQQQRSIFGVFQSETVCPYCNGTGKKIKVTCPTCNGKGFTKNTEKVDLNIPAGIQSGQEVYVRGKGGRGINGGQNGDLIIEIIVEPHKTFERSGNDIHINTQIDFIDLCLGTEITVPTIYGEVELKIPAGTQPNQILKLKDKGVKSVRSKNYGDQFVHIEAKTPTNLSKDQKTMLENFRSLSKKDETPFGKFKKSFRK